MTIYTPAPFLGVILRELPFALQMMDLDPEAHDALDSIGPRGAPLRQRPKGLASGSRNLNV